MIPGRCGTVLSLHSATHIKLKYEEEIRKLIFSHLVSFCPDVEQKWWKAADLMILRAYGSDLRVESLLTSIRTLLQLKCNKYVLNRENYGGSHVFSGCGCLCLAKKNHKELVNVSVNVLTLESLYF